MKQMDMIKFTCTQNDPSKNIYQIQNYHFRFQDFQILRIFLFYKNVHKNAQIF